MKDFIINHFESILTFIGGFLSGFSLKFISKNGNNNYKNSQKNIHAGGDVAGRDIKK